jgi:predicted transcriptional regulator
MEVRCPHCLKYFDTTNRTYSLILDELSRGELNIAQLSKKLDINRSTLNYFLQKLELDGKIIRKRVLIGTKGSPTIIRVKKGVGKESE